MNNAIITTGRKCQASSVELAEQTAQKLNIPFVERCNLSVEDLAELHNVKYILVAKNNSLSLFVRRSLENFSSLPTRPPSLEKFSNEIFFHPSLAHLRIKNILAGEGDRLIEAMNLQRGMSVLDCTLGLGTDAIVESFIVGPNGSVTALEINPYLAAVVSHGLKQGWEGGKQKNKISTALTESMQRVKVININYLDFLRSTEDNSFDVVYFDPMFRHSLTRSASLNSIREVADPRALTLEVVEEAKRVAKFRVVLKENAKSLEFARLGFDTICGGKYSPIHYGIIEVN